MAPRRIGVVPMAFVAVALDVGENDGLAVIGKIGSEERAALGVGPGDVAFSVEGQRRRDARAAGEFLALEPALAEHGIGQHVAQLGLGTEGVGEDVQSAAGLGGHAVKLVAHVVVE